MDEVDLNADLGEGVHPDVERGLFGLITSANIACGGHAGDVASMRDSCLMAVAHEVAIGAHPSYEDTKSFGRGDSMISAAEIHTLALRQIGALAQAAESAKGSLSHVKAHGALYHRLGADMEAAASYLAAVGEISSELLVVGAPDSQLEQATQAAGMTFVAEGFADRGYLSDGSLLPRGQAGALLGTDDAWHQVLQLVGAVDPLPGIPAGLVRTICVHGDGDNAISIAEAVRAALDHAGVALAAPRGAA